MESCRGGPDGLADLDLPPKSSIFSMVLYAALMSVLVGACLVVGYHLLEANAEEPYRSL